MTAAQQPVKHAKTATGTAVRGTAKRIREAGVDFNRPVLWLGQHLTAPMAAAEGTRYESVTVDYSGARGVTAEGKTEWLGGVATRFWLQQIEEAPVEEAPVEEAPAAAPAADADDSDLDGMTFAQVMVLAKLHKVPGRGVARLPELREGVRKARREGGLAARGWETIAAR